MKLGLIIDLTNTTRFYDKTEVERAGINHVKMNCKGLVNYLYSVCHFSGSFFCVLTPKCDPSVMKMTCDQSMMFCILQNLLHR